MEEFHYSFSSLSLFKENSYEVRSTSGIQKGRHFFYSGKFLGKISELSINEGAGFAFFDKTELHSVDIVKHDLEIINSFFELF